MEDPNPSKDLVRRFYEEAYSEGDYRVIDELFSPAFSGNERPPSTSDKPGPELVKESVTRLRTAFPDFHPKVQDLIAEGNTMVAHLRVTGTHQGPWVLGPSELPFVIEPTGTSISFHGLRLYRFEERKVVASRAWMEELDLLIALDAVEAYSQWFRDHSTT